MEKEKINFQFMDFIYLNTNILESFTAQKYKGFPKEMQAINIKEDSDEKIGEKENRESGIGGKLDAKFLGAEGNVKSTIEGMQFNHNITETAQNIMLKVQKDNMYARFFEYIQQKDLLIDAGSDPEIGMYINLHDVFYYIDFDRIQKLCQEKYRHIYESYDNNFAEFSCDKLSNIRDKTILLQELIPFDALLYNGDHIILIDEIWLREKKEKLGYLLGGKIHVVGKVSKLLQMDNQMPDVIKFLNKIQEHTLSLLQELGFEVSEKVYMISPIAIYH